MKFAKRVSDISASSTMAVAQEARKLRQQGIDIIDFGPGEPDFPTPEPVKRAGISAIEQDFTKYTASGGIPELRQAVADRFNQEWNTDFSSANVLITCGAKHAIFNVCTTLFEEGDEVLIPAPYWVTFPEAVKISGATPRIISTREEDGFVLDLQEAENAMSPRCRGLIVNTPNNPTGAVVPGSTVERIAALTRDRGIFLFFDETYDYFVYGENGHVSLASTVKSSDEFYVIVGSLSKTYSMTGWRIGFCLGNRELISKMDQLQSHQTSNPTSISQKAALVALSSGSEMIQAMKEEYQRRRGFVLDYLEKIPGLSCSRPEGAFYVFPNISGCLRSIGLENSEEFAKFLIQEARVAVVPGSAFGMEGYIRISYATSTENLQEGLSRIRGAVSAHSKVDRRR